MDYHISQCICWSQFHRIHSDVEKITSEIIINNYKTAAISDIVAFNITTNYSFVFFMLDASSNSNAYNGTKT